MSLLLDALKKAAEQKAEKNKQELPEAESSDETEIRTAAEDASELDGGADNGQRRTQRNLQDETEIDESEFNTPFEEPSAGGADGTETRLEGVDATTVEMPSLSAQMQTGEDETIIFADEDVEDFMGEPPLVSRAPRAPEDETELTQLAAREQDTRVDEPAPRQAEDETELTQLAAREQDTRVDEPAPRQTEDETDLTQLAPHGDETGVTAVDAANASADETDLSQLAPRADDTDVSQPQPLTRPVEPEDQTDVSVPPASVADLEHAGARQRTEEDATDAEDMSLLLVERDQTNLTSPTSLTDPQMPEAQRQALQDDGDDGLALVDTTRHRIPDAEAAGAAGTTQSSATATTGIAMDTQTGATTRAETTSTRTYAPDNYDRTLMRLPSDDASKLFAGMKSDSDVVMTPEYAKKVFHSKSSAQRVQHYKFYAGIAVVILLALSVYALFEYNDQSANIDASLRPLKRDPMPGVIRPETEPQTGNLFAGVDERTIDIVQNADKADDMPVADAGIVAEGSMSAAATEGVGAETAERTGADGTEPAPDGTEVALIEAAPAAGVAAQAESRGAAATSTEVANPAQPATNRADGGATTSRLEVSSSERVAQKHIWLRDAYAAYQAGNDELAMSLYNKVLAVDPQNRNALLARAAINVQNNNSRDAIRDYQTLLLANPKDSLALASLISVANYSPRDTETQLKLMIRDEPDSPYLNFALANAYGAQHRWQEAQGHYFRALENNPDDPNYAYNLAVSLEHISQHRAAITYYRRALENIDNGLATFSREVVDQRLAILGKL